MVNPAWGSSIDRNEEQDSGPRRSSVERNKEADGFGRLWWGETKEGDAVGGARLTIEIGAEFPIGITEWPLRCRLPAGVVHLRDGAPPAGLIDEFSGKLSSRGSSG